MLLYESTKLLTSLLLALILILEFLLSNLVCFIFKAISEIALVIYCEMKYDITMDKISKKK